MVNRKKTEDAESLARLNSINRRDSAARRSTGSPLAMFASAVSDGVGATMGVQGSPLAMFASAVSDGVGATMGAWEHVFRRPSTSDACFRCAMEGGHGMRREFLPV